MLTFSPAYTSALNFFRWMAAFLVVIQHLRHMLFVEYGAVVHKTLFLKAFYFVTGLGTPAVMVFFVMSGLLVGGTASRRFVDGRYDATDFAVHRFSRIYTVLIPALLAGGLLDWFGLTTFNVTQLYTDHYRYVSTPIGTVIAQGLDASTLFGNLAMTQRFMVPVMGSNVALWSLAYEWWYYCLFWAVLGVLGQDRRVMQRIAFGALATLLIVLLPAPILFWFSIWLLGVGLAWSGRVRWRLSPWVGAALFAFILLAVQYSYTLKARAVSDSLALQFLKDFAVGFGFALLLFSLRHVRRLPIGAPAFHARMADFSYTTYLVHFPAMVLLVAVLHDSLGIPFVQQPSKELALYFIIALGAVYGYSYLFARLTEAHTTRVRAALLRVVRSLGGGGRRPPSFPMPGIERPPARR